jgi:hypothetical protein
MGADNRTGTMLNYGVDGTMFHGAPVNLSNEGFCVQSGCHLEPDQRIEILVLGLGRLRGIVVWSSGQRAGGRLEPLQELLTPVSSDSSLTWGACSGECHAS